ncbi:LAMI_0E02278g1_1 [Lachancea mirantina]|uniref:LAMI_0E02278g1_1 n=1 Tax=Lachancea mirantina TaxID=1230905 RepID=A0A1G4JJ28_9SACH|nr:LAMI_0E02278g1_1 [Lachancea mirantina]
MSENGDPSQKATEPEPEVGWRPWWFTAIHQKISAGVGDAERQQTENNCPGAADSQASWCTGLASKLPSFPFRNQVEIVDPENLEEYSKLSNKQIQLLELEAQQAILKKTSTWCWFEAVDEMISTEPEAWGELSVATTGSAVCPLPLKKYPISEGSATQVYVRNSLMVPNERPDQIFRERPSKTKLMQAIKQYYQFPTDRHLYMRRTTSAGSLEGKRILVLSFVGGMPDRYEKLVLRKSCSARHLSMHISSSLKNRHVASIKALSFECPLDQKSLDDCFQEATQLIQNWKYLFRDCDAIFLSGIYHSVPLVLLVLQHLLKEHTLYGILPDVPVGLLAIESCLGGYDFWDHSSDVNPEDTSSSSYASKEKALFQNSTKVQQEFLSKFANYKNHDSDESLKVQQALDWILHYHRSTRLTLIGRLYDNFMTISQKLAVEYQHPNIVRHAWCDGAPLGVMPETGAGDSLSRVSARTPHFDCPINVPEERLFEISLMSDILLAINLGKEAFVPVMRLISPFYISRSFNEHSMTPVLRKQKLAETRTWFQDMDTKWKDVQLLPDSIVPEKAESLQQLLEFICYSSNKNPEMVKVRNDLFDDAAVYDLFLDNTVKTVTPLEPNHMHLSSATTICPSIYSKRNQYDLVWRLHSCFESFIQLKTLPVQPTPHLTFHFSRELNTPLFPAPKPVTFPQDSLEARRRLSDLWTLSKNWNPPTNGLKHLKRVLGFLSLYSSPADLIADLGH